MNAMEQMAINLLTKMTGLDPEKMQEMALNAMSTLNRIDASLKNTQEILARIEPLLPKAETVISDVSSEAPPTA